jgi:hypothetical protein
MRRKTNTNDWPEPRELHAMRRALGTSALARQLGVSRSTLMNYLNAADARDQSDAIIESTAAFTARLSAAIASGGESAASACASIAVKAGRPRRVQAIAPRSYCGSSAAWCVGAGD